MINTLFLTTVPVEPTFVAFFQHSQTHFHGLSYQLFQISLKNSELKTTHNAFQDCHMHFFPQPFSKQLYMQVIFCLMHKQDSKSVQMNKHFHGLSKEGKTWEGTQKQQCKNSLTQETTSVIPLLPSSSKNVTTSPDLTQLVNPCMELKKKLNSI